MGNKIVKIEEIRNSEEFNRLIQGANYYLGVKGYTEHGIRHVSYVSKTTGNILRALKYDKRTIELGEIAGWIHDIGNCINRLNHGITGATLAYPILIKMGMPLEEVVQICMAIGNHEEECGIPVNPISAALIIADKSDAHRTRVHVEDYNEDDIHDRVNFSIKKNLVVVDTARKIIRLVIYMDTEKSSHMDFFQIYLSRMVLCEKASDFLNCGFELMINDVILNNHKPPKDSSLKLEKGEKTVSAEE